MTICMRLLSWEYLATSVSMATFSLFLGLVILWAFDIIRKFQNMFITRRTCCDLV